MKKRLLLSLGLILSISGFAQDDLLNQLDNQDSNQVEYTSATFKGTRIQNLASVEIMGKGTLEFRIAHRFGDALTESAKGQTLFGMDGPVALDLSFDYSLSDRFSVGISRTNVQKIVAGNVKYKILRQTTNNKMPVTLTYMGKMNLSHERNIDRRYDDFLNRMGYVNQLIVARKFSSAISLQLNVIQVHRNLVRFRADENTMFALGLGARYKLTKRVALTGEYVYRLGEYALNQDIFKDHLGIGVDIETGGHVFQLFLMNSFSTNEAQFVPANDRSWSDGAIRFGFNVSRAFSL
jgi:opacity protein-like surface antigen